MRAGTLNRRVAIEQKSTGKDAYGQGSDVWTLVRETWADIQPLSGGEALHAQAMVPAATVQIDIRYRQDVTAAMRVRYGTRVFDIGAAIDLDTRHETLRLICTEGLNQGG